MVEMIQFSERIFCVGIYGAGPSASTKGERRIEFDLGKGGTITELHCRELMDFVQPFYPKRAGQISQLIFELLDTHTRVGRINLDLFHRSCERLELAGAPDILIDLLCRTVKGARSEEDVSLTFCKC